MSYADDNTPYMCPENTGATLKKTRAGWESKF